MRRVLVIGSGGSGKSTLAREIGARTGLPVVHLDRHFWRPGWVEPSADEWDEEVRRLVDEEAWVMDGNYGGTMRLRFPRADTVVFLDRSRWLCIGRVLMRRLRYHGRTRPDLAEGCPERLDLSFLRYLLTYPRTRRPGLLARLEAVRHEKEVIVLRSGREVEAFLDGLASSFRSAVPSPRPSRGWPRGGSGRARARPRPGSR